MNQKKLNVGVLGCFQNGKSTFVNCFLDDLVARTGGEGMSVTSINTRYVWGDVQDVRYFSSGKCIDNSSLEVFLTTKTFQNKIDEIVVQLWKPILKKINLIDTPGFNASTMDDAMAESALNNLDCAIVVIRNQGISSSEEMIFTKLHKNSIPTFVLMNCYDYTGKAWEPSAQYNSTKIEEVKAELINKVSIKLSKIDGQVITPCNLRWFWVATEHYKNDHKEVVEEIEFSILNFLKRKLKKNSLDKSFLLEESNFLPIRRFFDANEAFSFPIEAIRLKSQINKIFRDWESKLKQLTESI